MFFWRPLEAIVRKHRWKKRVSMSFRRAVRKALKAAKKSKAAKVRRPVSRTAKTCSRITILFFLALAMALLLSFVPSGQGSSVGDAADRVLDQLLTEMDGNGMTAKSSFLNIGAMDRTDGIDPVLLRPRCLGQLIYIPLLDEASRLHIFKAYIGKSPISKDATFTSYTQGFTSGADITQICQHVFKCAIREDTEKDTEREKQTEYPQATEEDDVDDVLETKQAHFEESMKIEDDDASPGINNHSQYSVNSSSNQCRFSNNGNRNARSTQNLFPTSTSFNSFCKFCVRAGHDTKECRKLAKFLHENNIQLPSPTTSNAVANATTSLTNPTTWMFDSGASHHTTPDLSALQSYSDYGCPNEIVLCNAKSLPISHTGNTTISTPHKSLMVNDIDDVLETKQAHFEESMKNARGNEDVPVICSGFTAVS